MMIYLLLASSAVDRGQKVKIRLLHGANIIFANSVPSNTMQNPKNVLCAINQQEGSSMLLMIYLNEKSGNEIL